MELSDTVNTNKKDYSSLFMILFCGGLWGLLEASLGSLLHLDFFEGAGLFSSSSVVMVSIASLICYFLYKSTGKARDVAYCGLVAAGIKMLCLCLPIYWSKPYKVVNPAISIILESLMLAVFVYVFKPKRLLSFSSLGVFLLGNILWRGVFIGVQELTRVTASWPTSLFSISKTGEALLKADLFQSFVLPFFVYQVLIGLLYCLVVGGLFSLLDSYSQKKKGRDLVSSLKIVASMPVVSAVSVLLAVSLTIGLALL